MDILLRASQVLRPYKKDSFLLAVSGGADSMALAVIFLHMRKNFAVPFSIAHIHHGCGEHEPYRDQAFEFVKNFCDQNEVPFHHRKNQGGELNSEKALRDFRYEKLRDIMEEVGCQWIVTAHHAHDLLETRMMRLVRGTGLQGLEAMSLEAPPLLRPLLEFSQKELRELLQFKDVKWVEDESNLCLGPLRNWMRHHWLPQLEEKQPGALASLSRSLDLIRERHPESFSCIQGDEIVIPEFLALKTEERKQALAFYMKSRGLKNYGQSHIHEILKRLDTERKDLTFKMLRHQWRVNAGRMKVLGLGQIEPARSE